jgi:hypothetical protein
MKTQAKAAIVVCCVAIAATLSSRRPTTLASPADANQAIRVGAASPEAAGKYIVRTSGCNDCHTPDFPQLGEKVPEAKWLVGNPVGFRGPWGTTYPQNLRRFIEPFTAEQFVEVVRKRHDRPPMPWSQLHAMSDQDLVAVYRYLQSLSRTHGAGEAAPDYVPPDAEPKTPFILMVPQNLPPAASAPGAQASAK